MSSGPTYRLDELSSQFGLELRGAGDTRIEGVATLSRAGPGELAFLANPAYRRELATSSAAAIVMRPADTDAWPGPALLTKDPYVSFARIASLFDPAVKPAAGIHASAAIDPTARIHASASVGPHASIGARSRIDAGAVIGAGCVVGEDCEVGAGSELVARVTLVCRVRLGQRVRVHPGAVLGADGFGLAMHEGRWLKVPQLGGVRVGDDCEIGANTTVDRGALDDTVLEEDVRLDNQIQVGHNVVIGAHTAMAGCVAIAGSTRIGRYCLVAGGAGFVGHITVADHVRITAMTMVTHSIDAPGEFSSGIPMQESRQWRRNVARIRQLDDLARRIRKQSQEPNE